MNARAAYISLLLAGAFSGLYPAICWTQEASPPEWTIMVYMNGKNNLEDYAGIIRLTYQDARCRMLSELRGIPHDHGKS